MKKDLKTILSNPRGKLIAIDLDETLSTGKFWEDEPQPIQENIDKVWVLYKKGAHIIIYTARQPLYYALTLAWLIRNKVPFHGIAMSYKPSADVYIDNKSLNVTDL